MNRTKTNLLLTKIGDKYYLYRLYMQEKERKVTQFMHGLKYNCYTHSTFQFSIIPNWSPIQDK